MTGKVWSVSDVTRVTGVHVGVIGNPLGNRLGIGRVREPIGRDGFLPDWPPGTVVAGKKTPLAARPDQELEERIRGARSLELQQIGRGEVEMSAPPLNMNRDRFFGDAGTKEIENLGDGHVGRIGFQPAVDLFHREAGETVDAVERHRE
jgi:hypothetical protein